MELATTIYFWEDGEVAAYGLRNRRPHKRVFAYRTLDGEVKKTDLVGLISHARRLNDAIRYRYGVCRVHERVVRTLTLETVTHNDFFAWAERMHPKSWTEASLL